MAMNRRGFLQRVVGGVAGACLFFKVPLQAMPAPIRERSATMFLLQVYNNHFRGRTEARGDSYMVASQDLYDSFYHEIPALQRLTTVDDTSTRAPGKDFKIEALCFKDIRLFRQAKSGPTWTAEVREGKMVVL